jgi:hypothetical protein
MRCLSGPAILTINFEVPAYGPGILTICTSEYSCNTWE